MNLLKSTLLIFAMVFIQAITFGQVTNSSMSGFVKDVSGEALVGATVKATHVPSGTIYGSTTNLEGRYNILNMRVGGPYKIEFSYVGFVSQSYEGISLSLGQPYNLSVNLNEGLQLDGIEVVAYKSDPNSSTKTGAATSITNEQIATLPTVSRNISDFTRLTPQANGNSFSGRDGRFNNFQVDGANFNNGFGLNDNPLPGGGGLPLDAIEQIQVNIAPYDVRQSGFSGAGINAVTRSGTNNFTGSAYAYFGSQSFQGDLVNGESVARPLSNEQTYGFRLGGPIIKDKLFFFVNAEQIRGKGAAGGAVNLWRASQDGVGDQDNNITRVKEGDLIAVQKHLRDRWGYDPGRYQGFMDENTAITNSMLARVDWNINSKNRLAVRFNQVKSSSPSLTNGTSGANPRSSWNRVSANAMAFENSMYSTDNIVRSVSAELNSNIGSNMSNQFLVTYSRIQATRGSNSSEFPMIDIGYGGDSLSSSTPFLNYITAGYELFSYGNDVLNDNWSMFNNLTYTKGIHTFTAGVSFEIQKFGNRYQRNGTSYYRYASVEDFLKTGTSEEVAPLTFALTYPYEGQDAYAPIVYGLPALYIQDEIDLKDNFSLTLGLRAEMPIFLNELTPNTVVDTMTFLDVDGNEKNYNTGSWPKTRVMLSPRVGFRWDVSSDNSFIVRGGTGIFAGRVPFVWLTNMPSNLGVIQNTIEPGSYAAVQDWIGDIRFNPEKYYWLENTPASAQDVFIKNPNEGVPGTIALVDEDFKMPQVWRTSLGADYRIKGTPFTLTADFIYSKDIQGVYQFGANRTSDDTYLNDGREWYKDRNAYTYNNGIGANSVSVLTNTNKGHSYSATFGVSMVPSKGFYGSVFYTYTNSQSTTDNQGSNASSAWGATPNINNPNDLFLSNSAYALPHRVMGSLSYSIGGRGESLGTTFSIYYNGINQGIYSYTYNGDINGDAINSDLMYVPRNASELRFNTFTAGSKEFTPADQIAAFDAYINENLSDYRGGFVDRNTGLLPWLNRFDFKFIQDIYINKTSNNRFQLSLDVLNVANLINSKWGVRQQLHANANRPLKSVGIDADGVPTFEMTTVAIDGETFLMPANLHRNITTSATTWSLLAGIRYIF